MNKEEEIKKEWMCVKCRCIWDESDEVLSHEWIDGHPLCFACNKPMTEYSDIKYSLLTEKHMFKNGICRVCSRGLLEIQKEHEICNYCGNKQIPIMQHYSQHTSDGDFCDHGVIESTPLERSEEMQKIIAFEKKKYGVEYRCECCGSRLTKEEYEHQQWFTQCVLDEIAIFLRE